MNNTSHNALFGTKTADNLMHAFEHESKSALRGNIYSLQASMEKDTGTRRMLDEISENGTASGELWLSYLDERDTTPEKVVVSLWNPFPGSIHTASHLLLSKFIEADFN